MARKKALKVGDEVVVINQRRWVAPPARVSVVEEIHPRVVYIKGHSGSLSKSAVARRTPEAERLGNLLDLLDKLEDEFQEERRVLLAPLNEKYEAARHTVREEVKKLYSIVVFGIEP